MSIDFNSLDPRIAQALFEGDADTLAELAGCGCCCHEHYHYGCPARVWGGCRGQDDMHGEYAAWAAHYEKFHGMSEAVFSGLEAPDGS